MQSVRVVAMRGAAVALHHCAALSAPVRAAPRVTAVLRSSCAPCRLFAAAAPAKVSMGAIKQLRERTGAPITECKDAISGVLADGKVDAGNEAAVLDAAVEFLRKKGISTAAKTTPPPATCHLVKVASICAVVGAGG